MRNPLNKRYLRELKSDGAKYLVIFLFMVMLISLVSSFLIADNNFKNAYDEGFEKYNIEDGHMLFSEEPERDLIEEIEGKADLKLTELKYFESKTDFGNIKVRVYKVRDTVDLECVMEGKLPAKEDEIALDRLFAENNGLDVGDKIALDGTSLTISGLVAFPDYSCLFENNSEMMFDSFNFGVGVMESKGFETFNKKQVYENYAWKYNVTPRDDKEKNSLSKEFTDNLKEILTEYNTERITAALMKGEEAPAVITIDDYVAAYNNKAIVFTGDDMGKDGASFTIFCYIVVVIIAFVFAVTISNTIMAESTVIGTLRASGFSRGQMIAHYMFLPVLITVLAAIIGNILGYTFLKDYFVRIYYASYSLPTYTDIWNMDAFVKTTVIPIILMFAINFFVLARKLKLSPLTFIRRQAFTKIKKHSLRLNEKISFMNRFRLRILFQNISSYIVLFTGVFLGATVMVFGLMFGPLLSDYSKLVVDERICDYQYIMIKQQETASESAEKNCVTSLDIEKEGFLTDDVTIMGIEDNSGYVEADIPKGKVLASNGILEKFGLKAGDIIVLKEHFDEKEYSFEIAGEYKYDAALTLFMNIDEFRDTFDKEEDYFNGYFSNEKLEDLDEKAVGTVIAVSDLTKLADQLKHSIGDFMGLFSWFGVIMFLLMMYVMTKQIIEKSQVSISLTKILGFKNSEVAGLYLVITSVVVVASLILSIPIVSAVLHFIFSNALYKMMTGYIPYIISNRIYVIVVITGIACYAAVAGMLMFKINRIPKSIALKNVE